ncbi:MAG: NADH:ubiquinone oxidoreductase, na translocating, f subunit [Cycloclasticus sp.]|nr:NADH:ubiquinone oxidoreductase, na translocating, f subunit [Cycloclasticus sp.]|tara:strand:+ start:11885 stop:12604 length:720 start_codon:yes stop_codon:yes gene_type:complete
MKELSSGKVVLSTHISKNILLIRIKHLEPDQVEFKAGQYLAISRPDTDKSSYYSIASSPNRKNEIELLVQEGQPGSGSSYMFSLKEGDDVKFKMPMGKAYLRENSEQNIIFVAGASGASYIRSMIHFLDETDQIDQREIHYFLGCREEDELLESDYMHSLAEEYTNFHYHPALSHQEDWGGHTGLVTDIVEQVMPKDMSQWEAYSAGSPAMVEAVANTLISNHNLDPTSFYSDLYTPPS